MGGLFLDIALCARCADMVFFVLKNTSRPNRHFLTQRPQGGKCPPHDIKQDFKKLKKAGNVRQPLMVALLLH